MKRSPLKRVGKQGKLNLIANKKIAELWLYHSIDYCEYPYPHDCDGMLTNAHKKKRSAYHSEPEKLYDFNEVARLCITSHNMIEHDVLLTNKVFNEIR